LGATPSDDPPPPSVGATPARSSESKENRTMQLLLSGTLLYGVLAATGIIIVGLTMTLVSNSTGYACDLSGGSTGCIFSFQSGFAPSQIYPTTLRAVISGVLQARPLAVIQLGVIVLLATPVLRVFNSLVLFALEKDRAFVFVTLFVLGVLLFSFFVVPTIPLFKA
jgi:uncharacterized membrane protein